MKDKTTAAIFALFLGWLGIHRFYLKQPGLGIMYILLNMVFGMTIILGIIDAIVLLAMDQSEFDRRYNRDTIGPDYERSDRRYNSRQNRREYRNERTRQRPAPRTRRRESNRPTSRRAPRAVRAPKATSNRERHNPFKATGIKKYKDFDLEGAIEDFVRGLEISPKDVSLHFNLACAYSLTEQPEKAFYHIDKAVAFGLDDKSKIKSHDDLAFMRIQPEFETFEQGGFRLTAQGNGETPMIEAPKENLLDDDLLLSQLKRLADLREKGLLTDEEFATEKKKLMRH